MKIRKLKQRKQRRLVNPIQFHFLTILYPYRFKKKMFGAQFAKFLDILKKIHKQNFYGITGKNVDLCKIYKSGNVKEKELKGV